MDALTSGLFEGEISCTKVKLHPKRNTFDRDDAFVGLCVGIEDWYQRMGKFLVEETRSMQKERRWQELGIRSLSVLKSILESSTHAHLREAFKAFGSGNVGLGHTDLPKRQIVGEQAVTSVSVDGTPGVPRDRSGKPAEREGSEKPTGEKGSHTPFSVGGPNGRVRKVVKDSSFGLQFSYEGFVQDPGKLWRLEMDQGILVFNSLHPHWVLCSEKSDASLMKLQELVGLEVLALLVNPESVRDQQRAFSDTLNPLIVSWILDGDNARKDIKAKA
jgi:hypothetical protein